MFYAAQDFSPDADGTDLTNTAWHSVHLGGYMDCGWTFGRR